MTTSPIRILLVEDNSADALLLQHTLGEAGWESFRVKHVERMDAALRYLAQDAYDAVMLDLSLPDSRGLETIAQVSAVAPHLPIVVMTGLDDEATALEAVRQGAQEFLIKGHVDGRFLARAIRYAIERKQAERQLKMLNETLEQRVAERTATADRRAAQLQALAAELTQTEHRERRRLAEILHDHLQQLLYAARLQLNTLRRCNDKEPLPETIDRIDALLGECIAESRSLTVQLCPPALYQAGLAAGIEWLGRNMEQTCGLNVEVEVDPQAEPESEEIRILLFEAARELLFNVVKHAETDHAGVSLTALPGGKARLEVSDEGAGFTPLDPKLDRTDDASGFGLFSIRERLELLGGQMQVETAPGRGTRVVITAPLQGRPKATRHLRHAPLRSAAVSSGPTP
jgi:signal transduction histidine kinase